MLAVEADLFSGGWMAEYDAEGVQMQTTGFGRVRDTSGVWYMSRFCLLPGRLSRTDRIASVEQISENRPAKSERMSGMYSQLMCTARDRVKQHVGRSVAVY